MKKDPSIVSAEVARRFLMCSQGLLADPAARATPSAVHKRIEKMGFVQVDTINSVERAHHHILYSRFDAYRPAVLTRLLERDRKLFEHWTHDAAIVPTAWFPFWKHRFEKYADPGSRVNRWMKRKMGDGDTKKVVRQVRERIRDEGPLMSKDFEQRGRARKSQGWWDWKPQKTALEYLWRVGELSISGRVNFHKVYELTERWLPDAHDAPAASEREHLDWACGQAIERLGVATPAEIQQYLLAESLARVRDWTTRAVAAGELVEIEVESLDGSKPRTALTRPDWRRRAKRLPEAPARTRLLNPFDPVIRDRKRALRLFDFDYTFEAFVPEAKRRYGYYVLPVLEGERLVGRVDPKFHRDRGVLDIRKVWWEPGVKPTAARKRGLRDAVEMLAGQIGAESVEVPR